MMITIILMKSWQEGRQMLKTLVLNNKYPQYLVKTTKTSDLAIDFPSKRPANYKQELKVLLC